MEKLNWKPGNMIYPVPAVMVSMCDSLGKPNIITVAWCGTVCTNPPMAYISVRPERYSYDILKNTKEFVINLVNKDLVKACDYCGVVSGRDHDKFTEMGLHMTKSKNINAPQITESPVNIECRVREVLELGSHHMFLADVVGVSVSDTYLNKDTGKFELERANLINYSHGEYYSLGDVLGTFGFSVKSKKKSH